MVGNDAHRAAFDARQRGEDAGAKTRAQLEQRVVVYPPLHHGPQVGHAQTILGH